MLRLRLQKGRPTLCLDRFSVENPSRTDCEGSGDVSTHPTNPQ